MTDHQQPSPCEDPVGYMNSIHSHPGYRPGEPLTHAEISGPPENPWGESTPLQGRTEHLIWGGPVTVVDRLRFHWRNFRNK